MGKPGNKTARKTFDVEHKRSPLPKAAFAVVTVSDTRTAEDDMSGQEIRGAITKSGNSVVYYKIVRDNIDDIKKMLGGLLEDDAVDVVILSGGTGVSERDMTIEAAKPFIEKELPGFSALFTQLSYSAIGSAALMSRALAGVAKRKAVFSIPGSPHACRLAMEKLIIPEAGHIMKHLGRHSGV